MDFKEFYSLLKKDTAKSFGYKSIKAAQQDGIDCKRITFTIDEAAALLKTDRYVAEMHIQKWKNENRGTYSRACGLNTFYIQH